MAILYRVADWDRLFENAGSRKVENLRWVPIPNKHDSDGYCQLVDHPNGAAHYGCWVAIVQVASKCQPRGSLLGGKWEPHGSEVLARKTRMPQAMFEEVLPRLVKLGWLTSETIDTPEDKAFEPPLKPPAPETNGSDVVAGYHPSGSKMVAEGKGRERNGTERNGSEPKGNTGTTGTAPVSVKKFFTAVSEGKLRDDAELQALCMGAVRLKIVPDSPQARLRFWGAACHALRMGDNPAALFVSVVRDGLWKYITAEDEDRAHERLKGLGL